MRIWFFSLVILLFVASSSFASAQVIIPENTAKNIESWTGIPHGYLGTPRDIIIFVVIPFVVAWMVIGALLKDLGIINSWLPPLLVFASFQFGFFKLVSEVYAGTSGIIFGGVAVLAFLITSKVRERVGSFGYSGVLSGFFGYVFDGIGVGIVFGGLAGAINNGIIGPMVYLMFFFGVATGILLIWWDKRGTGKKAKLKSLLAQQDKITAEEKLELMKLDQLRKRMETEKGYQRSATAEEMVAINKIIEQKKAEREALAAGSE